MTYFPQTEADRKLMLDTIGVSEVDELFASIPADLRFRDAFGFPSGTPSP